MEEGRWTAGLLLQAVSRARREALAAALEVHGMEDLWDTALPWLLDGAAAAPRDEEADRLLLVCRVVDESMLRGFTVEELAQLSTLALRLLRNLRGGEDLFG